MALYEQLKIDIQNAIRENGSHEITGYILQKTLLGIVDSLGNDIYTLSGNITGGVANDSKLLEGHPAAYFATAEGLNTLANRVTAIEDWFTLANNVLATKYSIVSSRDISSGDEGEDTPASGTVTGINVNGSLYEPNNGGVITLPDYPTSLNWSDIAGKPTNVSAFTNDAGYAVATDVAATYATQEALQTVSTKLDNFLEGSDTDAIINKWSELEAFLKGLSGSDDLATILGTKADKTTVEAIDTRLSVVEKTITSNSALIATHTAEISDIKARLAKVEDWFTLTNNTLTTKYNLVSNLDISSGETGGDADGSVSSLLTSWEDYNESTMPGYALSAALGYDLHTRVTTLETADVAVTVKLGAVSYNATKGVISLPAYPTTLPASDVYTWAKASTKPSYKTSEVTEDTNLYFTDTRAINACAGTYLSSITKTMVDSVLGSTAAGNANRFLMSTGSTSVWAAISKTMVTDALGYTPANNASLANYLPLSGGTIGSGLSNSFPLFISSTNAYTGLAFYTSGGTGYMRFQGGSTWGVTDAGWNNSYTLIHSGNIGSQFVEGIGTAYANQSINFGREGKVRMIYGTASNFTDLGYPLQYMSGLSVVTSYTGWQMVTYGGTIEPNPYFRKLVDDGTWSAWKKLAFLDDNVASATKLAGTYHGSADVSSNPYFWLNESGKTRYYLQAYNGNLCLGPTEQSFVINPSGSVGIGTTDLYGANKLRLVNTHAHQHTWSLGYLAQESDLSVEFKDTSGGGVYGLYTSINYYTGYVAMQVGRSDGLTNAYGLILQPLGGNVLIGTAIDSGYKLDVNGQVRAEYYNLHNGAYITQQFGFLCLQSVANEMCIGANGYDNIHINYRPSADGTAPKTYYWRAGTATSWADHYVGTLLAMHQVETYGLYLRDADTAYTQRNMFGLYVRDNVVQFTRRDLNNAYQKALLELNLNNDNAYIYGNLIVSGDVASA